MRLDRFFEAAQWWLDHTTAIVKYVEKQSSDHSQLILDTKPEQGRKKTRFYFDKRWVNKPGVKEVVRQAWEAECEGYPMFQVASKMKRCRLGLVD